MSILPVRFRSWASRMFQLPEEYLPVRFTCEDCEVVYEAFAKYDDQAHMLAHLENAHAMGAHFQDDDPDGGSEIEEEGEGEPVPALKVVGE